MRLAFALCLAAVACGGGEFSSIGATTGDSGTGDAGSGGADSGSGGRAAGPDGAVEGGLVEGGHDAGPIVVEAGVTDGRATSDAPAEDAGHVVVACPPDPPDVNSACKDGLLCSYGDDIRIGCRSLYSCDGGAWVVSSPACVDPARCSVFAELPVLGNACGQVGSWCAYDDNRICGCLPCKTLGCVFPNTWNCRALEEDGCPEAPPNAGQPCDSNSPACEYAFCPLDLQVETACVDGAWSWSDPVCPG